MRYGFETGLLRRYLAWNNRSDAKRIERRRTSGAMLHLWQMSALLGSRPSTLMATVGDRWGRERSYDAGGCWAPRDAQVLVNAESNKRWPTSCASFALRRLAVVDP